MRSSDTPLGGSISTQTANSFACNFFQNLLSGALSKTGAAFAAETSATFAETPCFAGRSDFTASAMARMCAGVVPQHPPRILTPRAAASLANNAKYSGEDFG